MNSINGAMHSLQSMQRNAQEALPVVPNNGNPSGAYNMPQVLGNTTAVGQPQPIVPGNVGAPVPMPKPRGKPQLADRYPWLRPTQSMDNVRALLANRGQQMGNPSLPEMPLSRQGFMA